MRLVNSLAVHDSFEAVPDDTAVVLDHKGCFYELSYSLSDEGDCLRLSDLRDLATIYTAPAD